MSSKIRGHVPSALPRHPASAPTWRWTLPFVALSIVVAGCAAPEYHADTPSVYTTAANCLQSNRDNLQAAAGYAIRILTVATADPALPPWWDGGTTKEHPEWARNDPYLGRGFEGALTREIAERLGVPENRIRFVPFDFTDSFAPGPKPFDFAIEQIPRLPERAAGVDFSEGYLDVEQALVSVEGSPISNAGSLEDLRDATLGAAVGTMSLASIRDVIRPSSEPRAFADLRSAVRALTTGRIDGIVADLPTASFVAEAWVRDGVVVGRLPIAGARERFAMTFQEGSPIVECVNLALREIEEDGTLDGLRRRWLPDGSEVPRIER
jgi:polar amino acid transport system substrate-binding protein